MGLLAHDKHFIFHWTVALFSCKCHVALACYLCSDWTELTGHMVTQTITMCTWPSKQS